MHCLITGGAGFIGSHLVDEALRRNWRVTVLDNFSFGHRENLSHCMDRINLVEGDIRDRDLVRQTALGTDLVFHHAALASVPLTVKDPVQSAEINDLGTLNVFLAAREAGVRRVVYASSSAVYGPEPVMPHHEGLIPRPDTPYAAHKLLGEHYAAMFGKLYGLEVVSLRYFNVFGPRQDPSSPYSGVISIFMEKIRNRETVPVYGDGGQSRDFIYIGDVVRAVFLAAETTGAAGRPINIGAGLSVTINQTIDIMSDLTRQRITPRYAPPRPGDIYASRAAVDLARDILGFQAGVSFEQGLAETWEWYLGH